MTFQVFVTIQHPMCRINIFLYHILVKTLSITTVTQCPFKIVLVQSLEASFALIYEEFCNIILSVLAFGIWPGGIPMPEPLYAFFICIAQAAIISIIMMSSLNILLTFI